ncbi:ribonuclease HII [Anaerobacillus alkaliphilus]|uniref:Ribonuclease HII n=2 Tax=Anaerobacillus alkaliphilus TaxID=1548597 RepID=A0A4Q0VR30_9BACI|nr:ribonuclease HII [Anaerobacillus alkaliphilus]
MSIKEIEAVLLENEDISEEFLLEVTQDQRIGAQKALLKWRTAQEKQNKLVREFEDMLQNEREIWESGVRYIAGIDEVGRGPLAGPVIAAAVILPKDFYLLGLTDSKKVTKKNREEFYEVIYSKAISIGIGIVSSEEIDRINIYEATKVAMQKAINELTLSPEHLLIDAMKLPLTIPQTSIIKGDSKSISIAASSIIAKVTRDRYMEQLSGEYPQYGFETNMGYGTSDHLEAMDKFGVTREHRRSFAPVRERSLLTKLF